MITKNGIDMEEIWKDIPGYYGRYQVSSFGNVKSIDRICFSNGYSGEYTRKGKIYKPVLNNKGYYHVNFWNLEKKKGNIFRIHTLVAMAFLNYSPCGMSLVVDHIDGNKLNNRVENLQVTTQRINSSKSLRKSYSKYVGVSFDKSRNKWISNIYFNSKRITIGRYKCEFSAYVAYNRKLKKINNERIY